MRTIKKLLTALLLPALFVGCQFKAQVDKAAEIITKEH